MDKASKRHIISVSIVMALFWLANSGHYNPLLLALGAISVVFVAFIVHRMDVIDGGNQLLKLKLSKLPGYYLWLGKEIVLSNLDVTKRVWIGNSSISPKAGTVKCTPETEAGKVIYANSITLTPGTVAIDIDGDRIFVHALSGEGLKGLHEGEMDRRVSELEH